MATRRGLVRGTIYEPFHSRHHIRFRRPETVQDSAAPDLCAVRLRCHQRERQRLAGLRIGEHDSAPLQGLRFQVPGLR